MRPVWWPPQERTPKACRIVGGLDEEVGGKVESLGEFAGLRFTDLTFPVEHEGDGSLRTEDLRHVSLFQAVLAHQFAEGHGEGVPLLSARGVTTSPLTYLLTARLLGWVDFV